MHDDEGPDEPTGKLYYSGINPHPERAEYALPYGEAALEGGEPEFEASDHPTSRRRFIASLIGNVALASGAFWLGQVTAASPEQLRHRKTSGRLSLDDQFEIDHARKWAHGPIQRLVKCRSAFLWVFAVVEPDATLIHGMERLAEYAVSENGEQGNAVAVALLRAFETTPAPIQFERYRDQLERVVLAWQTRPVPSRRK